jgi:curved DNA-binding protein CbpA
MGNGQSLSAYNPSHVRIYKDLIRIQDPTTRASMIRTVLAGPDYMATARAAGIYSHLLSYLGRVQGGEVPPQLPGEVAMAATQKGMAPPPQFQRPMEMIEYGVNAIRPVVQQRPSQVVAKGRRNEKAISYFQSCLQVLGLEEEVALTEDTLKRAYKQAAVKAHPDKGGSEEEFEAVTRAHAYLGEILRRIGGGGGSGGTAKSSKRGGITLPAQGTMALTNGGIHDTRPTSIALPTSLTTMGPVRLNPDKLDLKQFNEVFEKTRIPDPDDDGYGDWLKADEDSSSAPKFSGKFNRDVFNAAFEEDARRRGGAVGSAVEAEAITLAPHAVEIGRGKAASYTAAANASLKFTDLRSAYTHDANLTSQVANVKVEDRKFAAYSAQWKQGPTPLQQGELAAIHASEAAATAREEQRRLRVDQQRSVEEEYFNRMKGVVQTNK